MKSDLMTFSLLFVMVSAVSAFCAQAPTQQALSSAQITGNQATSIVDKTTGMEFVFVKGGCYQMGDSYGDGNKDEKPAHDVCVSDFYLGKYEVTQAQWQKIMENNPSEFTECGPDCPVDSVSWDMAQEFIRKLNASSGKQYRLPTEAEWEFAARSGGKKEKWAGISDETKLGEFAWYDKNSGGKTHKVGLKKPNGLGLYDMTGNVREWCQDWYNEVFYGKSPKENPSESIAARAPKLGDSPGRVMRGGVWADNAALGRSTAREYNPADNAGSTHGFRLLLSVQ